MGLNFKGAAVSLGLAACVQLAGSACSDARVVALEREAFVMGTTLRVRVAVTDRRLALVASEAAIDEVRRLERVLSSWRTDSELSALNASVPGEPVGVSLELSGLMREVDAWVVATNGAFDPAIGPLIDAWDLRGAGRVPSIAELEAARAIAGWSGFEFVPDRDAVTRVTEGAWISAGAFGKGAALRSAVGVLRSHGVSSALLDFGGQVVAFGREGGENDVDGWVIDLAHPRQRDHSVGRLLLRERSAATSAASERFVAVDGKRFGHIVDPRSGRPVPAWGSATVVAEDPLAADVLATALFVMESEAGKGWLANHPDVAALFVIVTAEDELDYWWSAAMEQWLVELGESS